MMRKKTYGMRHSDSHRTWDRVSYTVAKHRRTPCIGKLITKGRTMIMHAGICGPMHTTSCGSGRYFLAMTTGGERYIRVHILKTRDRTKGYVDSYVHWIKRPTNRKVGRIHTDKALEFLQMRRDLERIGIALTTSSAYAPQTNGLAERINGILLDEARSMIERSGSKLIFWAEATRHAADLHNRKMTVEQGSKTPMQALLGTTPDNSKLRVFCCAAFVHFHKERRHKKLQGRPTREFT